MREIMVETDKMGNQVTIMQVDSISKVSDLYTFFLRSQALLIENRHAFPLTTYSDSDGAVYAVENGKIIGHIVYNLGGPGKSDKVIWIVLSSVDPECRGRGIYTMLHKHLEQVAKEHNRTLLASMVHKRNKVRMESTVKVGMLPVFDYMMKQITDVGIEIGSLQGNTPKQIAVVNDLTIMHVNSISTVSELYVFMLREFANLIDNRMGYPEISHTDNDSVLYALKDDKLVGMIVYNNGPTGRSQMVYKVLSVTEENHRGQGIYSTLHKYLEAVAFSQGKTVISSLVHKRNSSLIKAGEKIGLVAAFNYMLKVLD